MSSLSSNRGISLKHRQGLAREAARIIAQGLTPDYQSAKQKARHNLAMPAQTPLPSNQEIEVALLEYQRLFAGKKTRCQLRELRSAALRAMQELANFKPRLTGAVLRGSVNSVTAVCLHLFAETIEEVGYFLLDCEIPYRHIQQSMDFGKGERHDIHGFAFLADGVPFELLVFSGTYRHRSPRCPIAAGPMHRAGLSEVQALLQTYEGESFVG